MKIIAIIILMFMAITANGQFDWDSKNWDKESLGFGCSVRGEMTKPVARASKLLLDGRFEEVRKLLYSDLPADQFLGVILAENLNKKKHLEISDQEMQRIDQIKNSNQMVPVCAGCTYWNEVPLHDLFVSENKLGEQYWFDTYYKIYRNQKKRDLH